MINKPAVTMHLETVTLDRVFDVQRWDSSKYSARCTHFSFESAGKKRYAVRVPGWPGIEPGHRLRVALGQEGNWQTLAGWRNLSTGELVLPDAGRSLAGVFYGLAGAVSAYCWHAAASTPTGRTASTVFGLLSLVFAGTLVAQWRRQKRLVRAIQEAAE